MDQLETDEQFDSLLQNWARAQPMLSKDETQQLTANIIRAAAEPVVPALPANRGWNRKLVWALTTGIVALAALFVVLRNNPPPVDPQAGLMEAAALPVSHVTKLMIESQALFANHIRWIADANRELVLGIDDAETVNDLKHPTVAVHVVVFRRAAGSAYWNTTWKTSIVLRNDEPVQIEMPQDHSHLQMWAHILPDRMVAVDSDYRRDNQPASNWRTATIPLAPSPEMVLSNVDGDGEIQVWQSAIVLGEESL